MLRVLYPSFGRREGRGGHETWRGRRFRGRKRHPCGAPRQNPSPSEHLAAAPAPGGHGACRGRRSRGRKRHPRGFPRQNPSPLRPPAAHRAPACREVARGRKPHAPRVSLAAFHGTLHAEPPRDMPNTGRYSGCPSSNTVWTSSSAATSSARNRHLRHWSFASSSSAV